MVAESLLQFPIKGINKFPINPIKVKTGDFLGIFQQNGGLLQGVGNFDEKDIISREITVPNSFFSSTNRIYAIRTEVKNELPETENFAGNDLKDYGKEDTFKNSFIVNTNNLIKEDGIIDNFEVYARASNLIRLVIYRGKGKDMKMVLESSLQFPIKGENSFANKPNLIKKVDFLGLFNQNGGSVAFKLNDDKFQLGDGDFSGKVIITKENVGPNEFFTSTNRVYALRANVLSYENYLKSMFQ